jgi:hypothetical protein
MIGFNENGTHLVLLALVALALEVSLDFDALLGGVGIS